MPVPACSRRRSRCGLFAREQFSSNRVLIENTAWPVILTNFRRHLRARSLALERTRFHAGLRLRGAKRGVQVGQGGARSAADGGHPLNEVWVDANFKEGQLQIHAHWPAGDADLGDYGSAVEYHGNVVGLRRGDWGGSRCCYSERHRQLDWEGRAASTGEDYSVTR
ncbi:MAG: hypothetical protein H6971_05050 [Gammaproteobacteria bacterium]|nr:hypothetical protein [Gammaproteobacteria bacterium]